MALDLFGSANEKLFRDGPIVQALVEVVLPTEDHPLSATLARSDGPFLFLRPVNEVNEVMDSLLDHFEVVLG